MSVELLMLQPVKPRCSLCLKLTRLVVSFLSRGMHTDGKPNMNRGAARTVRVCRPCVRELLRQFRKAP